MYGKLVQLVYNEEKKELDIRYGVEAIEQRYKLSLSELIFEGDTLPKSGHVLCVSNPYVMPAELDSKGGSKLVFKACEDSYSSIESYVVVIMPEELLQATTNEKAIIVRDPKEAIIFLEEGESIQTPCNIYTVVRQERKLFLSGLM